MLLRSLLPVHRLRFGSAFHAHDSSRRYAKVGLEMKLQLFLAGLLLASTAVHEAGHWLAGKLFGYRVVGLRWMPPGIHLRGPRGADAVAPPLEAIAIAIAGPLASFLSAWAIWVSPYRGIVVVWLLAGAVDIVGSDGYAIITALSKAFRRKDVAVTS